MRLGAFLGAAYSGGRLCMGLRTSPILGQLTVGALLGPPLADFVPEPSGLQLFGLLGVQLSILEAGLSLDFLVLKKFAFRATVIAVLGIALPLAGAVVIVLVSDHIQRGIDGSSIRAGLAAGAAIAPTSLGVAGKLLADHGELQTPLGQTISIAAILDDVLSLILLAEVTALANPKRTWWTLARPVVLAALFLCGAIVFAITLPMILPHVFRFASERTRGQLGLSLLMASALLLTYLATVAETSFLLAAFLTGVAFAAVENDIARGPWEKDVAHLVSWPFLLFFAATIGFVIPIRVLFARSALAEGALLAFAAVFGKLLCGLGMWPELKRDGLAVAVAMLGRGEFGFLIAAESRRLGLLQEERYASVVWGVLVPTIAAPLLFPAVFRARARAQLEPEA